MEEDRQTDDPDYLKWLFMLISPGSSLGGARPKACVIDHDQSLWIAKFPSRYDDHDMGGWEFVVHQLAIAAGIEMAECRIQRFNSPYHTFLTKRFDRIGIKRLHFTSAMTQLGYYDGDYEASYLELAEFITFHGSQAQADTESDNRLDVELAMEVIDYFRVKPARAKTIRQEVSQSVSCWAEKAKTIGLSRSEQEQMAQAFQSPI